VSATVNSQVEIEAVRKTSDGLCFGLLSCTEESAAGCWKTSTGAPCQDVEGSAIHVRAEIKVTAADRDTAAETDVLSRSIQLQASGSDLTIPNPRLWSPDSPFLYDVTVQVVCIESMSGDGADYRGCQASTRSGNPCQYWTYHPGHSHEHTPENRPGKGLGDHSYCRNPDGASSIWCYTAGATDAVATWEYCDPLPVVDALVIDSVKSYFGIRQVGSTSIDGHLRFTLNGKEIFHHGVLDQGWWPESLLTAPTDEALMHDVTYVKAAGFNMIRKHIKVEARRFYYHCDVAGLLVWQDQVSANSVPAGQSSESIWTKLASPPTEFTWTDADHAQYMAELGGMIDLLEFHPCIVVWTVFNEVWGQHRTMDVGAWMRDRDQSRPFNIASGGNFYEIGNIVDAHTYPEPDFPFDAERFNANYVKVIGEFGGHGWYISQYGFSPDTGPSWGYDEMATNQSEFTNRYAASLCNLSKQRARGVAAGVYTQLTDVEIEVNGLMTYNRQYYKIPLADLATMNKAFFEGENSVCRPWPYGAATRLGPDRLDIHGAHTAGPR